MEQVDFSECSDGSLLHFDGGVYSLLQMHIHSPSEHMVRDFGTRPGLICRVVTMACLRYCAPGIRFVTLLHQRPTSVFERGGRSMGDSTTILFNVQENPCMSSVYTKTHACSLYEVVGTLYHNPSQETEAPLVGYTTTHVYPVRPAHNVDLRQTVAFFSKSAIVVSMIFSAMMNRAKHTSDNS